MGLCSGKLHQGFLDHAVAPADSKLQDDQFLSVVFPDEILIVLHFLPADEVLEIALSQQERGADIVKIVTGASSMDEQLENLRITHLLKKELKVPFLFL